MVRRTIRKRRCPPAARLVGVTLAAVLSLSPQAAARQAAEPPASGLSAAAPLRLETIAVEGNRRAAAAIIVAESLLEPGHAYDEGELRRALYRLRRLPFLREVRFALRRGSRPGTYRLVITVEETPRLFLASDFEAVAYESPLGLGANGFEDDASGLSLTVGVRQFIGTRGVAFAAAGVRQGFQVGFTRYDLFGRRAAAGVVLSADACCSFVFPLALDPTFSDWSLDGNRQAALELALPLSGSRAVRVSASLLESDAGPRNAVLRPRAQDERFDAVRHGDARHLQLEARWVSDTTDDPLLPTRGSAVSAGLDLEGLWAPLAVRRFARGPQGEFVPDGELAVDARSRWAAVVAAAVRHLPVSDRQTISAGIEGSLGRARVEGVVVEGGVRPTATVSTYATRGSLAYALLLSGPASGRDRELRFEVRVRAGIEGTSPAFGPALGGVAKTELSTGLVLRNRWGIFRFALRYLDARRSL